VLDEPLHLLFVTTSPGSTQPTHVERSHARRGRRSVPGAYVETTSARWRRLLHQRGDRVFAGEGAVVDHYKVQQESLEASHVASMHVHAARKRERLVALVFARRQDRPERCRGRCSTAKAPSARSTGCISRWDRLVDNHTTIDHAKPHCPSHEIYKGILGGKARAVFNGKIIVRQDAQKTDAKQTNRALLLSDSASINTKPQLEIFADDVKCTHGAAIGQLDEDAIFYLRARGLTYFEARDMMIHAFAGEILDRVKVDPLRAALEGELFAQLAKDLAEIDAA
jgi:Fe-S cluster assembly protein SufD